MARANGAFPNVSQLVAAPDDPAHMVLRGTFGLLVTRNGGADWDWLCEAGMGYQDLEPPFTVLAGGTILLALPSGVMRSDPSGCDFTHAEGIEGPVVDVSRVMKRPGEAVALSTDERSSRVWHSTDGGLRFRPLGAVLDGFVATTLDVAPNDPERLYVSGVDADGRTLLLRSSDAGDSFERTELPATESVRRPFIAAVGPDDDHVFVRLDGLPGTLLVSRDGGRTFESVLELRIPIQGFALSPDGTSVLATNSYDGSFRADLATLAFEKVACRGPSCLLWTDGGLFGCGTNLPDGFILGASNDRGDTFERVLDLSCVRGPLACDPESSTGATCEAAWPMIRTQIGAETCSPPPAPTPLACGLDGEGGAAGASGNSGGAPGEGGTAGAGAAAGGSDAAGRPPVSPLAPGGDSGCGCELPRESRSKSATATAFLALLGISLARRATGRRRRPN